MNEGGQFMREVLCTGHTTTFGRSLRSLLAYINDVTSNSTACEFQEEKADAGGEHEVKHLRTQELHPNDSTALDLRIRDLRILDVNFHPSNVYSIIVRKHSVLLSLDPFKAVVMADRIIILVPPQKMAEENMDRILKMFENNFQSMSHSSSLKSKLKNFGSSSKTEASSTVDEDTTQTADISTHLTPPPSDFEYQAYELIFTTVHALQCHEYNAINAEVQNFLILIFPRSAVNIPYVLQEKMRTLKDDLSRMGTKVGSVRRALCDLLEDEEAMALMNLTKLKSDPTLYHTPLSKDILDTHDEIEGLIESHLLDIDGLEAKLKYLLNTLQNAEASVSLKLDVAQDKIMIANTTLSVAAVLINFASYWTGVFGMSLDQTTTIQNFYGPFEAVFVLTLFIIIAGIPLVLYYYERTGQLPRVVQRRMEHVEDSVRRFRGRDVMGISTIIA